jgi:cyclopropane fatty-acyl-phospholipid synthase-like methyltransferase
MPNDDATAAYFEAHVHDYSPRRLRFAIDHIKRRAAPGATLLDVGCGTGALLELLESETGIADLTGMDVSSSALTVADERVTCTTIKASILDLDVTSITQRFDFVVMAAVLHHLVAESRKRSRELAARALDHALELLTDDGRLVIVEPTFTPHWAMNAVFMVKRQTTRWSSERIEVMNTWNNIGAPVVSYYSPSELHELVMEAGAEVADVHNVEGTLRSLPKLLGIRGRWETTVIARRSAQ